MTLCYEVFLAETFDDGDRDSLQLMLHELYHTVQCVNRGGVGPFLDEYLAHGIGTIVQQGSFDIHDDIDHERDAENRAASLIREFGWPFEFHNECTKTVRLFARLRNTSDQWINVGWYTYEPGEKAQILSGDRYVHSTNRRWYFYAEEVDGDRRWSGDHEVTFDGADYMTIDKLEEPSVGNLGSRLTCAR
jgi:hypothetical protein